MAHTYFVMKRAGQPDKVLVWDTRTLSIGRAKDNDIVLADNEISRKHAIFKKEGNRCTVGDYQTGNGTFVNGHRIAGTEPQALKSGDVVDVASLLQLTLYDGDAHPAKTGLKLEYASHLKTVGMLPGNANVNPNATLLGMADGLPEVEDDDFVIERGGRDNDEAEAMAAPQKKLSKAIDLDEDLGFAKPSKPAPGPGDSRAETQSGGDPMERMRKLKVMHAEGLITDAEFERKRAKILEEI
jgi:hypothetical protein